MFFSADKEIFESRMTEMVTTQKKKNKKNDGEAAPTGLQHVEDNYRSDKETRGLSIVFSKTS